MTLWHWHYNVLSGFFYESNNSVTSAYVEIIKKCCVLTIILLLNVIMIAGWLITQSCTDLPGFAGFLPYSHNRDLDWGLC